ncbi:MAG: glycosyltransferase [Candidatus Aenigmatarchaeota archaeon]
MKAKKAKKVSIILPTYNRKGLLEGTIRSLSGLDYPRRMYEIVVVDDGSTDGTGDAVKRLMKELPIRIQYHRQENARLSAARNRAIKNSKGDIIVSIDDDMLFERGWLSALIKPLEDPQVGVSGGPAIAPKTQPFFERCADYCLTSFMGTGGIRGTTRRRMGKYYPRGGNMAIRKGVLDEIGLFDTKMIPGEDVDLDYRIERAGYRMVFVPEAFVWHIPRSTMGGYIRQVYSRGVMRVKVMKRYRQSAEAIYAVPSLGLAGLIGLAALSLSSGLAAQVLGLAVVLYALALAASGANSVRKVGSIKSFFVVPPLMFLQHLTYGVAFIIGNFR